MKHYFYRFLLLTALAVHTVAHADETLPPVAVIIDPFIEIHTGPGRGYPVFYVAERGEMLELLKQRTSWIKVRTMPRGPMNEKRNGRLIDGSNTKEGWVRVEDIALSINENGDPITVTLPQLDDFASRNWEMGVMLGTFGPTDVVSANIGYHFTRNLSVELELSENFGTFSSGYTGTLNIVHQPFPHWRYSPFFTLGTGMHWTKIRSTNVSTEDRDDGTTVVGGGLRIYLTDRLIMRVQYKHYTILTSRDDDEKIEEWKIGLSTFF